MRRGLRMVFDRELTPEEKQNIIDFFEGRCAYCGEVTNGAHDFDHLVSSANNGANHISNRVLSCKPCNHKLKRERDWKDFLEEKWRANPTKLALLKGRIEEWVSRFAICAPPEALMQLWQEEAHRLTAEFSRAVARLREVQRTLQL